MLMLRKVGGRFLEGRRKTISWEASHHLRNQGTAFWSNEIIQE